MRLGSIALFSLLISLYGCQDDSHNAQGLWSGTLMNGGITVDLGTVRIGSDFIDLAAIDERYEQLFFENDGKDVHFGRKMTANFQAASNTQLANRYPAGTIELLRKDFARIEINKIQGVIELTR